MFYIGYLLFAGCLVHLTTSLSIDCSKEQFLCDSGDECVERSKWCDKKSNCGDGSDELYCKKGSFWAGYDPNNCIEKYETHILCGTGICIPIAAKCDTYKDCKDNSDEEDCEITTTTTENTSQVDDIASVEDDVASSLSTTTQKPALSTAAVTNLFKEDEQVPSTTRDAYSSRAYDHFPSSTSYYDMRLKETDPELNHHSRTFPKAVPIRTHSIPQSYPKSFTTPRSAINVRTFPSSRSPIYVPPSQITYRSTRIDQQHQNVNPRYNNYQPPTHQYQHPTYRQQLNYNSYQPSSNSYQPSPNSYQNSPSSHQYSSNSHRSSSNSYQHSPSSLQPSSNLYRPSSNSYQPSPNSYQPPSHYYPQSSNSYQSASNHHQSTDNHHQTTDYRYQSHRSNPDTSYNGQRSGNGQRDYRNQINHSKPYTSEKEVRRSFNFAKDYSYLYAQSNAQSVRDGVEWLLRQRSASGDWGKDTPRAVIALALSSNYSFLNGDNTSEIIKRRFMVQIGADLIRNKIQDFNVSRLFRAINGLLAVCEDPTDFHGTDLAEELRRKVDEAEESNNRRDRKYKSPFVFLSLCLSNKGLTSADINNLLNQMSTTIITNEKNKDTLIAAIMAFSCYVHKSSTDDSNYSRSLRMRLRESVVKLLELGNEDGSFGSVYTTALATQALMSTNETHNWNASRTMNFLKNQQRQDGSFGDFLATYLVLPALSGKSLLHLRNINCNPAKRELTPKDILEFVGPKQYVHYSLYFGYPLDTSQSLFLPLPRGINFLDAMRVAEYQDQNFRFSLENNSSKVYSLSGLPNDSEMGLSWHLYVRQQSSSHLHEPNREERFIGDLRSLYPKSGEIFIFWYHSNELK